MVSVSKDRSALPVSGGIPELHKPIQLKVSDRPVPAIVPAISSDPLINAKINFNVDGVKTTLGKEFGLSPDVVTLVAEYSLHSLEKIAGPSPVRPAVQQRMDVIEKRMAERGFPSDLLEKVASQSLAASLQLKSPASLLFAPEALQGKLLESVIRPSLALARQALPPFALITEQALQTSFTRLDPLPYKLGSDGPSLRSQYLRDQHQSESLRDRGSLASRGSLGRFGRRTAQYSGGIDCSGFVLQQIRAIAIAVLTLEGVPLVQAMNQAMKNVPDQNTAEMLRQARKQGIGGLSKRPSAKEILEGLDTGKIKIGDALVVPPARRHTYGHTGILAMVDGKYVVQESSSGRGVIQVPLDRWIQLGNERGEMRIFRHPYLGKLGIAS